MSYKIAMVQMRVVQGRAQDNMERAARGIAEAAARGCHIAVLPECCDVGWGCPGAGALAEEIPGPRVERLCALARQHGLFLVAGLTEREGDACYNTAILISDKGRYLGKHRKINLLTGVEDMVYSVGRELRVFDTPFGQVGLTICADNSGGSLVLGHSLGRMGAQYILSPSAWAVPPEAAAARRPYGGDWLGPYETLARAYGMWVVGVSNVGEVTEGAWAGWKCIGNSIAMSPEGERYILPYGEQAEDVGVVETVPLPPRASGTALAELVGRG